MHYEILTGRPPFEGGSSIEISHQVLHREPTRPRKIRRGIDRELEVLCLACLEKDPGAWPASAELLAQEFARIERGEPIQPRGAGSLIRAAKWCRRRPGERECGRVEGFDLVSGRHLATLQSSQATTLNHTAIGNYAALAILSLVLLVLLAWRVLKLEAQMPTDRQRSRESSISD